jgi:HD superfamily phosphodiesterase
MPVLQLNSVRDATLWNLLNDGFSGADAEAAKTLAQNLLGISQEAYDRMKSFPSLHPEYTLHDEVHCLRVTELMYRVMPQSVIPLLNPVEVFLLILAAHFHDQGMVMEQGELSEVRASSEFKVFEDTWEIEHPNIKEVRQRLGDRNVTGPEKEQIRDTYYELRGALLTDFVRRTHGERSAEFIRNKYGSDPRWSVSDSNIAELVARLSASHVRSATELAPAKGFRHDEVIGAYRINMPYLGLVLRLADILDLDRDRTPNSLYRTIDFRSHVSLREWEKHRSVTGWVIEPTLVQFTMQCEHPEYQRAAYQFMDWIDKELRDSKETVRSFPSQFSHYNLELPVAVDRTRIEPKDDAYIYYDLEFSLSRDEIVKLLMTSQLYKSPKLCIRELLQNALDALRHRKALIKRDNETDWDQGKVRMEHVLDGENREVVRCIDNGVGMDRSIIERFLTKAGRSYYRSPEFEQERVSFREHGVDFDPCAQFGIGFMSCFMIGDRIRILTRRDNGPTRGHGEPLIVEINGLGGIIVIRRGEEDQPVGTIVEITGRKLPRGFEEWQDQVQLVAMLNGYAVACEFPIEGSCKLPEIGKSTSIPAGIVGIQTPIETAGIENQKTIVQDFSEVHSLLRGSARLSFLVDENGVFTLANSEAGWRTPTDKPVERSATLWRTNGEAIDHHARVRENQTCVDGILVAGEPPNRWSDTLWNITIYPSPIHLARARFALDIRGQIKPPLTPARNPPESLRDFFSSEPRWAYVQSLASQAGGRLWETVAQQLERGLSPEVFWQLAIIDRGYSSEFTWMRPSVTWSRISVPLISDNGTVTWHKISDLGVLQVGTIKQGGKSETFQLFYSDGQKLESPESLIQWFDEQYKSAAHRDVNRLVASMSSVIVDRDSAALELRPPTDDLPPERHLFTGEFSATVYSLPYAIELSDIFSVHMDAPLRNVNRQHPLVKEALSARYLDQKSELQEFADVAVGCLSAPETARILLDSSLKIERQQRNAGYRYEEVDWASVIPELRPPYKIRRVNGEVSEIVEEDFRRWAAAPVDSK